MKIAVCPNAFRDSLSALEAAHCIASGLRSSRLECEVLLMPMADGGNGTLEVWQQITQADLVTVEVANPLGKKIKAEFGLAESVAMVEMARASGIELLSPSLRNPLLTSSYGTGELIAAAIEHGAKEILVGIGGSATVDGGAGCLQALGARLLNMAGEPISAMGETLHELAHIDVEPLRRCLQGVSLKILCDVDNPLVGENGAAAVFAPQKGADDRAVTRLENNLFHFAKIIWHDLGIEIADVPRGGAGGGLSAGLYAAAGAHLVSGSETLFEACGYESIFASGDIDLVITGEGKIDTQSKSGKAPFMVARKAQHSGISVIAVAGVVDIPDELLKNWGFDAAWSIVRAPVSVEQALSHARPWLTETARQIGNTLALARGGKKYGN